MKLGKQPARHDDRTLDLARYTASLPAAPSSFNVAPNKAWPMYANDRIGDCTIAALGHQIEAWGARSPSEQDVVAAYSAITGYDPADPSSDQGAVELDVLNYWRKTGVAGDRIVAYAKVNPLDASHVRSGCWLFGGLYIGLALPIAAQRQSVWHMASGPDAAPGSWGGHAVNVIGYSSRGVYVVTWGAVKRMTWAFWRTYCDEAYALLSADWHSPQGLDLAQLQADLQAVTA
jgi:hypothetical protein